MDPKNTGAYADREDNKKYRYGETERTPFDCEEYMKKTGADTCCRQPRCQKGRCQNLTAAHPHLLDTPWVAKNDPPAWWEDIKQLQCIKEKKPGEVCEGFSQVKMAWWHDQCPDGYCDKDTLKCTQVKECKKDWQCGRAKRCYGADEDLGTAGECLPICEQFGVENLKSWSKRHECTEDRFCSDKSCFPRIAVGKACPGGDSCVKGADCEGETCVEQMEPVEPSTASDDASVASNINVKLAIFSTYIVVVSL